VKIQAEVSLYALRQADLSEPIEAFLGELRKRGLSVRLGAMSTAVTGESRDVFEALEAAFEQVARTWDCVLIAKYSNACPSANLNWEGKKV